MVSISSAAPYIVAFISGPPRGLFSRPPVAAGVTLAAGRTSPEWLTGDFPTLRFSLNFGGKNTILLFAHGTV